MSHPFLTPRLRRIQRALIPALGSSVSLVLCPSRALWRFVGGIRRGEAVLRTLGLGFLVALVFVAGCTTPQRISGNEAKAIPDGPTRLPQRVVSLAPSITEMVFALGAGPRLVGCTVNCDYPEQVKNLPRVGGMVFDFEKILALHPDLVVVEGFSSPQALERLHQLGLKTLVLHSDTLEGYTAALRQLGTSLGCEPAAARLLVSLQAFRTRASSSSRLGRKPRVFVEIGSHPLWSAAQGSLVDELVGLAGADNVCHDLRPSYPKVGPEQLVTWDPDVVVLTTSGVDAFCSTPAFAGLRAVRARRVYRIEAALLVRGGPRLIEGVAQLVACFNACASDLRQPEVNSSNARTRAGVP